MKHCTFYNNTSDSVFTTKPYQRSTGGLSIGYNSSDQTRISNKSIEILIINCKFISNTAAPLSRVRLTTTDILIDKIFPGHGGALTLLVNANSSLNFVLNDSIFINNIAETFGASIYCIVQRACDNQTYIFANNIFMNHTAPSGSGLLFANLLSRPVNVVNLIYNCTFVGNTATSNAAGTANIYPLYGLQNYAVTFKDCKFYNNSALVYGGAVDIATFNFFKSKEAVFHVEFINWLVQQFNYNVVSCYHKYIIAHLMVTKLLMVLL